jgi:RNA polymerase sigma-70 factor (ECF subfamily)
MVEITDAALVDRSVQGDSAAFAQLLRRYEHKIVMLIRYEIYNAADAEDVLQETLLQAWTGIRQLRDTSKFGPWLLRVARNRCRDFHRSSQRRDEPKEAAVLEAMVNRFGHRVEASRRLHTEVIEALEEISPAEREIARQFYLEGFTIAEIASRHNIPLGTVKWKLIIARDRLSRIFGIQKRRSVMSTDKKQPFPLQRPEIIIKKLAQEPWTVDCPEYRWFYVIPNLGEKTMHSNYGAPDWKLIDVYDTHATRLANFHDIECIEMNTNYWTPKAGWRPEPDMIYGRLTEKEVQCLAVIELGQDDKREVFTMFDEGFDYHWGNMERQIEPSTLVTEQPDGSLIIPVSTEPEKVVAESLGVYEITIGSRRFTCVRIIEFRRSASIPEAINEGYLTKEGRVIIGRGYSHPKHMKSESNAFDENDSITANGVKFWHQFDSFSKRALGIS